MAVERTKIFTARITVIEHSDNGLQSDEDAKKLAKKIEDKIMEIPSIDDATVDLELIQNFDMNK